MKAYGKQKVFWIDQSEFSEASPEELQSMDAEISKLEQSIKDCEASYRQQNAEYRDLANALPTHEVKAQVEKVIIRTSKVYTKSLLALNFK